jgi:hypothetical protein
VPELSRGNSPSECEPIRRGTPLSPLWQPIFERKQPAMGEGKEPGLRAIISEFAEVESGRNSDRPVLAQALAAARLHRVPLDGSARGRFDIATTPTRASPADLNAPGRRSRADGRNCWGKGCFAKGGPVRGAGDRHFRSPMPFMANLRARESRMSACIQSRREGGNNSSPSSGLPKASRGVL